MAEADDEEEEDFQAQEAEQDEVPEILDPRELKLEARGGRSDRIIGGTLRAEETWMKKVRTGIAHNCQTLRAKADKRELMSGGSRRESPKTKAPQDGDIGDPLLVEKNREVLERRKAPTLGSLLAEALEKQGK